jgi:molybdopterin synthase catalytic subunit
MAIEYLIVGPVTQAIISQVIENAGKRNDTGGHSIFLGQVRADNINGKFVRAIEYSAYDAMVKAEADKIKEIILSEFSDAKTVEIVHSTGIVSAGEISLFVMVSAGHRQHATEACSRTVELLKDRLPVWKKELFDDDSSEWRENI